MSDHDLLALYALDSLPEDERAAFDDHLATCADCRRELADLGPTLEHLADPVEVAPPPDLRARVLSQITQVEQEPAPAPVPAPAGRRAAADGAHVADGDRGDGVAPVVPIGGRRRAAEEPAPVRWLAAAAVILAFALVAAGATGIVLWNENVRLEQAVAQAQDEAEQQVADSAQAQRVAAVLAAPDARLVGFDTDLGGTVRVAVSDARNGGAVLADDLPAPPQGRTYQLWLLEDGTPVSAGVVEQRSGVLGTLEDVAAAQAVAISIEPTGGSDAPTGDIVGTAELR